MKKKIIFSIALASLFFLSGCMSGSRPHGHQYYVKHSKHHKSHKLHKPHGRIDATYQN